MEWEGMTSDKIDHMERKIDNIGELVTALSESRIRMEEQLSTVATAISRMADTNQVVAVMQTKIDELEKDSDNLGRKIRSMETEGLPTCAVRAEQLKNLEGQVSFRCKTVDMQFDNMSIAVKDLKDTVNALRETVDTTRQRVWKLYTVVAGVSATVTCIVQLLMR